jgi:hypothetical protein
VVRSRGGDSLRVAGPRRGLGSRVRVTVAALLLLPNVIGCYSTQMVAGRAVSPGSEVIVTVNDKGRVGLGERMGPGVLKITGRLAAQTDSVMTVNVASVEYLEAGSSIWSGEQVRIPADYVAMVNERTLSRSRSWLAAGAAVAAVVVSAVALDLTGAFSGDGGDRPGGGDGQTALSPR